MLVIQNQDYFDEVVAFAKKAGMYEGNDPDGEYLKWRLDYLENFGGDPATVRTTLFKDFAPHSFEFVIEKQKIRPSTTRFDAATGEPIMEETWERWFNGGLIFFNTGDTGVDKQLSVCLTPTNGWSIHT